MSYFTEEERAARESVGECTAAMDHETHWIENEPDYAHGYCIHCGAEFIEDDVADRPIGVVE